MVTSLKKVGLFGGSFNPAHEGHLYISLSALEKLGLDEVWWLVSPKNPQKARISLAPFDDRIKGAKGLAEGHPIRVSVVEQKEGFYFSIDTVRYLKAKDPEVAFVWIMGADCFKDLHTWKDWRGLMAEIPIVVFPRKGFTEAALGGKAATAFSENRILQENAKKLVVTKPPAWVYIDIEPMLVSATEIRGRQKG